MSSVYVCRKCGTEWHNPAQRAQCERLRTPLKAQFAVGDQVMLDPKIACTPKMTDFVYTVKTGAVQARTVYAGLRFHTCTSTLTSPNGRLCGVLELFLKPAPASAVLFPV